MVSLKKKAEQTSEEKLISFIGQNKIPLDQIKDPSSLKSLKKPPDYIIIETIK